MWIVLFSKKMQFSNKKVSRTRLATTYSCYPTANYLYHHCYCCSKIVYICEFILEIDYHSWCCGGITKVETIKLDVNYVLKVWPIEIYQQEIWLSYKVLKEILVNIFDVSEYVL